MIARLPAAPLDATALWYPAKGQAELRPETLPPLLPGCVLVRTHFSAISRGTERLVCEGMVGTAEWERMRAPFQAGSFGFPIKYGYSASGIVEEGLSDLLGCAVFCLHPHQDRFVVPADSVVALPDGVSPRRAVLAANMETALNALWDSGAGPADRIVVIGAGVVGLLVAYLAARLPGAEVTVVDLEQRQDLAASLGARFARPASAPADADVVFHTSASSAGLATAIDCAGTEAKIIEMSWFGDRQTPLPLGGAFHSRRLQLVSSQVGSVSPGRRPRWTHRRRIEAALRLLADPALDALVQDEIAFADTPALLPRILTGAAAKLPPVIRYPASQ